jgi:hypothetical protein
VLISVTNLYSWQKGAFVVGDELSVIHKFRVRAAGSPGLRLEG